MKFKKLITFCLGLLLSVGAATGCSAQMWEEKINVVFKNEGQIVDSGTVTQFDNYQSPVLDDAYIPNNYRFLGWTPYSLDDLDYGNPAHFKTQYIGGGRMVHYMDVRDFAVNTTVVLNALIMHKDDIPKEYHYAVIAWYAKSATSGLTEGKMQGFETNLRTWLTNEGVTEDDLNTLVLRPYSGNVGPTTGEIIFDNDVDIMFGWGSLNNITTTGQFAEEDILQSESFDVMYNGEVKGRHVHRLSENPGCLKVMEYLLSQECRDYFLS